MLKFAETKVLNCIEKIDATNVLIITQNYLNQNQNTFLRCFTRPQLFNRRFEMYEVINGIYKWKDCQHCGNEWEYQCEECEKAEDERNEKLFTPISQMGHSEQKE